MVKRVNWEMTFDSNDYMNFQQDDVGSFHLYLWLTLNY